jgi:hypothetical protein
VLDPTIDAVPDPYLAALIDRVEGNGEPLPISVALTSGAVVSGFLRRARSFPGWTMDGMRSLAEKALPTTRRPSDLAVQHAAALANRAEAIEHGFAVAEDPERSADFVTLSNVTMVWSSGDGLKMPTLRVRLDAVAAWWVVPATAVKRSSPERGGFFLIGGEFDL